MTKMFFALAFVCIAANANADNSRYCKTVGELFATLNCNSNNPHQACLQVNQLSRDLNCETLNEASGDDSSEKSNKDVLANKNFGPTECLASNKIKEETRALHTECESWLKSQKKDLGSNHRNGVCSEECEPCDLGLKKCSVKGVVHYVSK